MVVLLLHTSGHGLEDHNIYFPVASGLTLRPLVLLENVSFSMDIFASIQRREWQTNQLLGEARRKKRSLVNRPISGRRGINLERGQGQLARVKRCTGLYGEKVECQGQEKFCGRTVVLVALVGVMMEILHLWCIRLKRTWKIMWPQRHSRTEVAKSLRSETQRRYVFLKYLCVAFEGRLSILRQGWGFELFIQRLISWKFGHYTIILVGINHSCWIDPRSLLIPMVGIERQWKANFRFQFCRPDDMTHKVPNISIYGNKYAQIPNSANGSGCALHRKFQGSFKSPTRLPRATGSTRVSDGKWPQLYPARHKMGFIMSRLWVSWVCRHHRHGVKNTTNDE